MPKPFGAIRDSKCPSCAQKNRRLRMQQRREGWHLDDGWLTAREVRLYLDSLCRRGAGVRSIRYVHATLRAAQEDALREGLLKKNVAKLVRPPSIVKTERHPLAVDEIQVLLTATRDDRLHAMFVVMALRGLRRSEVLGLRWEDIDLTGGTLAVRRGLHRIEGISPGDGDEDGAVPPDDPDAGAGADGHVQSPGGAAAGAAGSGGAGGRTRDSFSRRRSGRPSTRTIARSWSVLR